MKFLYHVDYSQYLTFVPFALSAELEQCSVAFCLQILVPDFSLLRNMAHKAYASQWNRLLGQKPWYIASSRTTKILKKSYSSSRLQGQHRRQQNRLPVHYGRGVELGSEVHYWPVALLVLAFMVSVLTLDRK